MRRICLCLLWGILLAGCDPFEYHPYDARLEKKYKDINRKNLERMRLADRRSDTVRFAFTGDTQRWYDETEDFVEAVNKRQNIDFVIHGGDLSDFGMKKEISAHSGYFQPFPRDKIPIPITFSPTCRKIWR